MFDDESPTTRRRATISYDNLHDAMTDAVFENRARCEPLDDVFEVEPEPPTRAFTVLRGGLDDACR